VFDKTGTLTEEGLSVLGFRTASSVSEISSLYQQSVFNEFTTQVSDLAPKKA
jgi:magnesium-transporting ATPase (P-type)